MATNELSTDLSIPKRDGGALLWLNENADPELLRTEGWTVHGFGALQSEYILSAQAVGTERSSLANPAQPILDLVQHTGALAILGVSLRTPADLRDLYGYIIEPAFRADIKLLVSSDREIADLDPQVFVDPVGFPWTLERLRHLESRFRLAPGRDGQPPMTPIEAPLWTAMRKLGLAPVAQYGIGPYRADFAFPDVRLVVECDGRQWHDPERDQRRDAELRRRGWEPLHFSGSELHRDVPTCAQAVYREFADRRVTIRTTQPQVATLPSQAQSRPSAWERLVAWVRSVFGRRSVAVDRPTAIAEERPRRVRMPEWAGELDPEQAEAVLGRDGVSQVIAPAGSGKTTVLIARVRELVARGLPPNRILCCTFNRAAAEGLEDRLEQVGVEAVKASTFSALGRRILDDADLLRGKPSSPSYGQWRRLAKQAMDATEEGVWFDAPDAKDQISDLKLGRMVTVEEFAAVARTPAERTLAELYRRYEEHQVETEQDDFDDYIFRSVRLLQQDAGVRVRWQREFSAVLVDESQDIEPAQELLAQILASPEDLLLSVGDEDQCIYAWRRASVERVVELDLLYPGLERHALVKNYRCPVSVVTASRALISHNKRRFPKAIEPARSEQGEITLVAASDAEAQGAHAARLVKDLEQGQVVVLARTASMLSTLALGLAEAGVHFTGPERIKRRSGEQGILLSYMRLLGSPHLAREEDVEAVFRVPNRFLPDDAEINIGSALRGGMSFGDALGRLRIREPWRRPKLEEAGALFDELAKVPDASEVIHRLRTDGGLDRHYADAEQLTPTDRSSVDSLAHAEDTAAGMSVVEFADALDYQASIIEKHFDPKGIELATIHGAKGRQWPLVIIGGMDEGILPHARSLEHAEDPEGELEGERRLAYVAMTRSSDRLIIMHSDRTPSRFVAESALAVGVPASAPSTAPLAVDHTTAAPNYYGGPSEPRLASSGRGLYVPGPQRSPAPDVGATAASPSAAVPSIKWATARALDGSIPCSLPGCTGRVGTAYVAEAAGRYVGLCPRFEVHEALVMADPALEDAWLELRTAADGLRQRNRLAAGPALDGSIPCSLPGCMGTVRADFVQRIDGEQTGLCPQKELHAALARRDHATHIELQRLEAERREAWQRTQAGQDYQNELLRAGGIPCSVPGCVGVVSPDYILDADWGEEGICGLTVEHDRLAAADSEIRAELDRLIALRRDLRGRWRAAAGD